MKRPTVNRFSLLVVLLLLIGGVLITSGCARFDRAADFTADPTSGEKPLVVRFTPAVEGAARRWIWSFGDGHTSTERRPEHTYDDPGTYTVLLAVFPRCTDTDPVTVVKEDYITVTAGLGLPPRPQDAAFLPGDSVP